MKVSVSILSIKKENNLKELVKKIESNNPDFIHIDVMDGEFVEDTSFTYNETKDILDDYNYDVHLMVKDPIKYINDYVNINPKYITFHIEIGNTLEYIDYIKNKNIKVGIAINPNTDLNMLYPYLDKVDLVLLMGVEPGRGGQEFIMNTVNKIDKLYSYRKLNNLNYLISIDGGVSDKTISLLQKCDIVVSGSYVTNNEYNEAINTLRGET